MSSAAASFDPERDYPPLGATVATGSDRWTFDYADITGPRAAFPRWVLDAGGVSYSAFCANGRQLTTQWVREHEDGTS